MILAHKIQLDPTHAQEVAFRRAAGCARFTWNWALAEAEKHYKETGKAVNFNELKKRWNREKPAWVLESPKDANQQVFTQLKTAYARFFKRLSRKPRFKSKRTAKDSFYLSNTTFTIKGAKVRLPKIGWVRLTEELRFDGKVMSATVSRTADRWFISLMVDTQPTLSEGTEVVGVDLGFKSFATLSSGEVIDAPLPLYANLDRLRRRSRQHSRKVKGSKNRNKSRVKLARLHARITNIRKDFLHKTTSELVARTKLLVIEDLSLQGMFKLWGRKASDLGLYEFRRQLSYKCAMRDVGLLVVSRWFPSTKTCSSCGHQQTMSLSDRVFDCGGCGVSLDRDYNAALNLYTAGLAGINACGHEGSGLSHKWEVKPSWLKQELNLV